MKKLAIVGTRNVERYNFTYEDFVKKVTPLFESGEYNTIVSGGADGIDSYAAKFAQENGYTLIEFLPEWERYGKAAGPVRNEKIVKAADHLVAIYDGKSKVLLLPLH